MPPRRHIWPWGLVLPGYLVLAVVVTWPLVLHLSDWTLGFPTPDNMDTAQLRRVVAMGLDANGFSDQMFPPDGYPAGALMPNQLDHLLALPLVKWLPWPLADNLWWLAILTLNGVAGHLAGWSLSRNHRHGVLCGVAVALAEPVLREANLGHAPQTMVFAGPLVVLALARTVAPEGRWRHGVGLGAAMALAGITYWYFGLFFAVLCLPVVVAAALRTEDRPGLARVGLGAVVCVAFVAWPLWTALSGWDQLAMTDRSMLPDIAHPALAPLPRADRFLFSQSADLLWPVRSLPPDRSSRVSLVLVAAALWGTLAVRRQRFRWWVAAGLGGVMLMGPFLAFAGEPVLVGGKPIALPWYWISTLSPTLERLHWPQRWGVVVPLALLPLAARCPHPLRFAAFLMVETVVFSHQMPIWYTPTQHLDGWRALSALPDDRSVLVVPARRNPEQTALLGYAYRAAEQPLIAETRLPAGAATPDDWWARVEALGAHDPRSTVPLDADTLRAQGIGAVVLDTTPGGSVHPKDYATMRNALARRLDPHLGEPVDYGSVTVWWVTPPESTPAPPSDPEAWRASQFEALSHHNTMLEDTPHAGVRWNVPQHRSHHRGKRPR